MSSNKNQHFVPKCYLRQFSTSENNAVICLFNLDREKFVSTAPIKHQCSGNYFYGKDELLEQAIQSVEGAYATTVKRIHDLNYRLTELDRTILRTFWLFQHLRTEAAAKRAVEMSSSFGSAAGVEKPDFKLEIHDAVQMAMKAFSQEMRAVSDLKLCLLKNKTNIPFVTSDNPAIATNRWHFKNKQRCGLSFGLKSAGLVIMLPLSPSIVCIGYDSHVYSVSHKNGWSIVKKNIDVNALNQHQYLNCNANVYFHHSKYSDQISNEFSQIKNIRPEATYRINYAVLDYEENGHKRFRAVSNHNESEHKEALIHVQRVYPEPKNWPHQITWRNRGVVYTNGTGVGYLRREWCVEGSGPRFTKELA